MSTENLLNKAAQAKGYTPLKIAAAMQDQGIECSPQSVNNWLSGQTLPRLEFVLPLCRVLGIKTDDLLAFAARGAAAPAPATPARARRATTAAA